MPDLPYDREVVPDGSEAPGRGGFVGLRADQPRVRSASASVLVCARKFFAVAALTGLLACAGVASAHADDLSDRRKAVAQQIARTKIALSESSQALNAAGVAVDQAQNQLVSAAAALAETQRLLAAAHVKDVAMAARLKLARAELKTAKAAVVAGQARLDAQKRLVGEMVRDQYQQQTNLLPLAILVQSASTADLQTRVQWSTTMFDTTQAKIDRMKQLQVELDATKAQQAKLEKQVAQDRAEAAANLVAKQKLESAAQAQEEAVASLLRQRQAIEEDASQDVAQDKARYVQLNQERVTVEKRIAIRIAKAKAKAKREAAARRAAAAKAAAKAKKAARAAKAAKAKARAKAQRAKARAEASSGSRGSGDSGGSGASHDFEFPVSAPISSAYGMRFHPILRYWKLHDGTDFAAGCGTKIRAAYSGEVAEKYYNAGYGNRLMIDHGKVDGKYVTTGYNHAIRYTVRVG
ncbi:MAG TPA: peptidoglycan DD-metalloendopeptidase family protein, partial [Brevundimonas sp.]|nr:peptidoglycan DD-metalloendopeptidase family protein [Brevundimonas sp.]